MMRIKLVTLHKIKSFDGPTTLHLDDEKNLYSLSGKNGSGKSSVLRAIWLIQKIHFCVLLNAGEELEKAKAEASKLLSAKDSSVRIELSVSDDQGTQRPASITLKQGTTGPELIYTNSAAIATAWNAESPSNIFLFIDASKEFSTETLRHDGIKISSNSQRNLVVQAILNPEQLFHGVYKQLITDYVHERLVPSKPNRLEYYRVAKHVFTKLVPEVELSNFSGNHKDGEFVLLGKANRSRRSSLYDVRDFSSGEKTLLSTLVILSIASKVSAVLIDEPENHLHESLLLSFIGFLRDYCQPTGAEKWLKDYSSRQHEDNSLNDDANFAQQLKINQVIYTTHSKSLIYHTFSFGQNFLIEEGVAHVLDEDLESKLRRVGISSVHKSVIFVEGEDDNAALHHAFGGENFVVRPLNGSADVADTYKRIARLGNDLRGNNFAFVVDSDNKPDAYFDDLRSINPKMYDRYFIRLDRHELENYLLEPELFLNTLALYHKIHPLKGGLPTEQSIRAQLVAIGKESLPQVYKKELSLAFQQQISSGFSDSIWGNKKFDWSSEESIIKQISENALSESRMKELGDNLQKTARLVFSGYSTATDHIIIERCDGKQTFSRACAYYAKLAGVETSIFKNVVFSAAFASAESPAGSVIQRIRSALN
ncbi:ABC-type cobalamin/Fe3+-siderophores transport system ATPase subunit [Stenotrophomonas rhizophila]|uniref:ABC-type cobalamin/Fe3+-siderophores transport system ATPase subunit n=1 Tax=Stenotrophomonas rhizophila TaxID=216778 RepID=A0AAP5AHN2_9GAMM|nr:AAA family ATPase [Stenotrophomonas rhizophila]MDQ1108774.1 ABC-type cobalamin/Fe3+-siderophores transport system ATPase subunit [Stenotrophomonas rhizophila]